MKVVLCCSVCRQVEYMEIWKIAKLACMCTCGRVDALVCGVVMLNFVLYYGCSCCGIHLGNES